MNTYARIDNGFVVEIIGPVTNESGIEIPITDRYTSEFVASLVNVTSITPQPQIGWSYVAGVFAAPDVTGASTS